MDFICACLLVFLWYVRPQDIIAALSGVSLVKYLMYAGIIATVRRPGGLSRGVLWMVPMDWLVTAYCVWAIYVTDDHSYAAKEVFTYFSFHMVTALALSNWRKIEIYLNFWFISLGTLALLAVSTHWGFELVKGSAELTMAFHDRLTLNTWIYRNPNALGHGVMALIPGGLAWFLMSGSKQRALGLLLIGLAVNCVLLTQSKGAYLAGAGGLTMLFLFKRPIWFQIVMVLFLYGAGFAVLKSLPRMDTLSKSDEGIQGRMIVWQQAKTSMEATTTGVGLKLFQGFVPIRNSILHRTWYMPIATHGSYVRHGADLGYVGLMLFVGVFYGGVRVLMMARTLPESEASRAQRTIYALLVTMAFSCFVVDRAYHMDFFLLSGLVSAFHRRFVSSMAMPGEKIDEVEGTTELPAPETALQLPAQAVAAKAGGGSAELIAPSAVGEDDPDESESEYPKHGAVSLVWNRIGVIDLMIMYALMETVVYYWDLFSTDFIVF